MHQVPGLPLFSTLNNGLAVCILIEMPNPRTAVIRIRPATPADLTAIGRLAALPRRTHHDFDPKRFLAPTSGTEHAYGSSLGTHVDEPTHVSPVVERDGEVVGYTYAGV